MQSAYTAGVAQVAQRVQRPPARLAAVRVTEGDGAAAPAPLPPAPLAPAPLPPPVVAPAPLPPPVVPVALVAAILRLAEAAEVEVVAVLAAAEVGLGRELEVPQVLAPRVST